MGTWRITIEGQGCHHNGPRATECNDANYLARVITKLLKAFHHITKAEFVLVDYLGQPTASPENLE